MRIVGLFIALALVFAPLIQAQETGGQLEGRVLSSDGTALAEVEITVTSDGLLGQRVGTSNQRGGFRISALPVGTYRVRFRRVGFRALTVEQVPVRLGATTSLPEVKLEAAAVGLEEVIVTAAAIGLDPTSTASGMTLDATRLAGLPLDRNFREIVLLAPGATPSFYGYNIDRDGVNVAGATGYENNFFVDGIDITSPIRGESSIDLPYNFLSAIQVSIGGSAADNAGALGGVVNVVTPSGGNRLKGQVFGFFSSDAMQTGARPVTGYYQTGFTFSDVGGSLSGPIVRDRLWFFAAYNANYEQRENTYGFGTLADTRRQHVFAGKLTWQPGPRTSTTFTILGDPSRRERLAYGPLVFSPGVPLNAEVLQLQNNISGVGLALRVQHSLKPGLQVDFSAAQTTRLETYYPLTEAGYAPPLSDAVNGTLSGGYGDNERYDGARRSLRADISWQGRSHNVKAGAQYEVLSATLDIDLSRTGAGGTLTRQQADRYTWHSALSVDGKGRNQNSTLYVQDAWQLSPRILLNAGLRWSSQSYYDGNGDSLHLKVRDGLQPRVGLVYQPGRLGSQRLYASYARIADQIVAWHVLQYGIGAESLLVFPRDPRVDTTGMTIDYAFPYLPVAASEPQLRGMTSDEFSLGYDRRLTTGTTMTLRVLRRALRDAVQVGNDTLGRFVWGNPGRGVMALFPRPKRTYTSLEATLDHEAAGGSWVRASYILSRTSGNYPGLYQTDWELGNPHYGPQYFTPEQHTNGDGLLPNDRTHMVKLMGTYRGVRNLSLGGSGWVTSGTPLSEFGAISIGPPFRGFVTQRGTAGRTPTIWDLNLRAEYLVPFFSSERLQTRLLLDGQHLGSPRGGVRYDQFHYTCLDGGTQSCPNARYAQPTSYQVPMTARLGVLLDF